ncbi:MAG: protein kinase [Eubacteriales bacterium]|nr:protein kinase [Eubacteriales bacterium]
MSRVGTVIGGKYEILKKIGQGGMSIVYVAMDIRLNKQWAVKEIKKSKKQDTETLLRSLQMEANILKKVDHPVLPRIVDIIHYDGTIFVVMDYIEGRTLNEVLKKEGAQPQEKVLEWAKELCSALDYLHSMNPPIIYRDMKPSNIMLKPNGKVKLIDFGTAKEYDEESLADTTALGTKGYAAPEQFGDSNGKGIHRTDARTDIYSLGASLYHIITGKNPCEPPYMITPIRYWDPTLSSGLEKILLKCTKSNPEERYQNCTELMYALEHYEEMDDAFKKQSLKRMRSFLVSAALTICCAVVSVVGYIGDKKETRTNYQNLMNEGYTYTVQGKYEEASQTYIEAITQVDSRKNTAYLELLNLYINYMNDPEKGLNRVTYYIEQGTGNIDKDQTVILNVAMDYFDILKDYKTSAYYFNLLDEKEHPEAKYYSTIALAMGELNVDYAELLENLEAFERLNDELPISVNKFMNYRLLCVVYSRNLKQIEQASDNLVRVATKGCDLLEEYNDYSVKAEYYTLYHQYMASAYEVLGNKALENQTGKENEYFEQALDCCDFILGMVSDDDDETVSSISDIKLREAKYCQKANIYEAMGKYEEACEIYEQAEMEYEYSSADLYTGHLSLLCRMQENKTSDVENWDYETLFTVYQEGLKVSNIKNDYRWKQLTQKLSPLFKKKGGKSDV